MRSAQFPTEPGKLHFKPRLHQLLQTLRLDIPYERGSGDHLFFRDSSGDEVQVLDLVGGYGSLLLGHGHPTLVAEAQHLLLSGRPIHAQGSRREDAARLARELSIRAGGDYCVTFANSGAEAVEAAMKHAMLETGSRTFIALEGAFHGKTLGALQLTANPRFREPFELEGLHVLRVPLNNVEQLEAAFAQCDNPAGFIFEPILGEGGVRPVHPAFARRAAELCAGAGVPLIADECQTGVGRTGTFLATEPLGVKADYVILSKALGGGIAKISALLVRRERYRDEFDLQHTSTFAADDFSCGIALKTLALADEALLADVRRKGTRILDGLRSLAAAHPGVIADARGRGLMIALEFCRMPRSSSFLLRYLNSQEDLATMIAGYLLHTHRIRVAPTLSDRFSLRLQPSALIHDTDIQRLLDALDDVCVRLETGDALRLTQCLAQRPDQPVIHASPARSEPLFAAYDERRFRERHRRSPHVKVGWICHMVDADDLVSLEPQFDGLPFGRREDLLARLVPSAAPVVMGAVDVRSVTGAMVQVIPIMLPFTSRWVKGQLDNGRHELPQALVQQAVDLAQSLHCRTVALGQYTSIATFNGIRVAHSDMGIATGNSTAVAFAIHSIEQAHRETGRPAAGSVLVVAGAAGNIGRICAELLAPGYRKVILVGSGRPGSRQRLETLARRLPNAVISTDPAAILEGDVVLAALNAVDAPLTADRLAPGAIVCDLSVPASVADDVAPTRPDLLLIKGGIVSLPFGEDLEIVGFPLPRGQTYACMAEAMLLGLEGIFDRTFTGSLNRHHVDQARAMAARHGFQLADFKRHCVLGGTRKEESCALRR